MAEADPNKYWGFECANCRHPIRTADYVEGGRGIVHSDTLTIPCGECEFEGEYLRTDIRLFSISEQERG